MCCEGQCEGGKVGIHARLCISVIVRQFSPSLKNSLKFTVNVKPNDILVLDNNQLISDI
jgi:hypothetical protein